MNTQIEDIFLFGFLLSQLFLLISVSLSSLQFAKNYRDENKNKNIDFFPSLSIVIPAYNEERHIKSCLDNIYENEYTKKANVEVVIVNDGSKDGTSTIVAELLKDSKYGFVKYYEKENGKRASAINFGINKASNDIVICLDADTTLDRDALFKIVRPFLDDKVCAVAGQIAVKVQNKSIFEYFQFLEYKLSMEIAKRSDNSLNLLAVISGAFGAFRRTVFNFVNFDEKSLAEDMDITFQLKHLGCKVDYVPEAIAYTLVPTTFSSLFNQRVRWFLGFFQTLLKFLPKLTFRNMTFLVTYLNSIGYMPVFNIILHNILLLGFFYYLIVLPPFYKVLLILTILLLDILVITISNRKLMPIIYYIVETPRKIFLYFFNNIYIIAALLRLIKKDYRW